MPIKTEQEEKISTQAMMEVYTKLGTPGAPHQFLASSAGSWKITVKSWMEPGMPPTESTGTSELKMIMGGRFLQEEFTGEMMGKKFTGLGITGYDNHTKKYVSTWIDSMGTAMLFFEGFTDPENRVLTLKSRYDDPFKGSMTWRSVTTHVDENTCLVEMCSVDRSGKEEKMMEMSYVRRR